MTGLTRAQQRVLDFIEAEVRTGRTTPTLREIASRFGFRSHRAAACHLEALKRKGFIESDTGKARSLRIISPLAKLRSRIVDILEVCPSDGEHLNGIIEWFALSPLSVL
jgi:repressor LexA